jgi:hypothetical protein
MAMIYSSFQVDKVRAESRNDATLAASHPDLNTAADS